MKKILWMAAVLGVFAVFPLGRVWFDGARQIAGVSQQNGRGYEEWTILKRDGTFEQLIRFNESPEVEKFGGRWVDAKTDAATQLFAAQTGTKIDEPYLSLEPYRQRGLGEPGLPLVFALARFDVQPSNRQGTEANRSLSRRSSSRAP